MNDSTRDWMAESIFGTGRVLMVVMPILGCIGGYLLGEVYGKGTYSRWKSMPTPPTKAVEIIGGDPWNVYIMTEDGRTYVCHPDRPATDQVADCTGEEVDTGQLDLVSLPCEPPLGFMPPNPPGNTVARIDTYSCHFEVPTQGSYALLEDGSLWRWAWSTSTLGTLARAAISLVAGAIAGAIVGILIILAIVGSAYLLRRGRGPST